MNLSTRGKFLIGVGGLLSLAAAIFIVIRAQPPTDADPCFDIYTVYFPVIQEFGPDYVILQGSGQRLESGDIYRYTKLSGDMDLSMRLLEINQDGITAISSISYESPTYHGAGEGGAPYVRQTWHCKGIISRDDPIFRPRFESMLIQPSDFPVNWETKNYTEYVIDISDDGLDETGVEMTVALDGDSYTIAISMTRYKTEQDAIDGADQRRLTDLAYNIDSTAFPAHADEFVEGCWPSKQRCFFEGRYGDYRIYVMMQSEDMVSLGLPVPTDVWHAFMYVVEEKLIEGTGVLSTWLTMRPDRAPETS
jgi:hypothetical protein